MCSAALAQLTTITGTIQRADGSYPSGTATISWNYFVTSGGTVVPAGSTVITISAGIISTALYPNANSNPPNMAYSVVYNLLGVPAYKKNWFVPAGSPVLVTQIEYPPAGNVGPYATVSPAQLTQAGAVLGECMIFNGNLWTPGTCSGSGGSPLFSSILTGTNTTATMTVGTGGTLTYSGSGSINANKIIGTTITSIVGNSGGLLETTGGLTSGRLLSADASSNATDSGVVAANVIVNTGTYSNPAWITALAASKLTGTVACAQLPALTGDATTVAGTCATTVSSTNGLAFAPSATINALNASNISSGTLPAARLPAINLAASGAGGVTGNLPVTNLNSGTGASSTTAWFGDGTWKSIAAGGTVTNTSGPLVAGSLIIGNSGNDVTILGSIGTSAQVLHGNAGGSPSWGAVSLTADVTGTLATANGGLGSTSIAFTGPSGAAKNFTLPNASTTILTTNAAVTLAQGGTGTDLSAIAKGGLVVGTTAATVGIKAVGTDGQVLSADSTAAGGVKWIAASGTGTVTSIATTSPITGGTITTTGTIACATCVTSAAALTANQLVLGGGSQASAVIGTLGTTTTVLHGNSGGAPSFAAVDLTADVTGALPAANGGSGQSSYAVGDILYASGATALSKLADIATGNALISGGVTTAPSWGKIGLTTHVSGTLPIANGGTGTASTLTGLVRGSGSAMTAAELSGDVATSGSNAVTITANAVTSAKMAVVNTRRTCTMVVGADNASSVLVNGDLGPQGRWCYIPAAATVVEIMVAADGGTPNVIVGRNHAGTIANLVSSALATAGSGGLACSNAGGTTGIDGTTTCSATLQNTSISAGDWMNLVSGTAGGTAKRMSVALTYTVN